MVKITIKSIIKFQILKKCTEELQNNYPQLVPDIRKY